MQTHEATTGRTIVVVFDHGDDFYTALQQACADNGIRQGYIPMFIAGFASADLVGTCERLDNPDAPVWSKVHLTNIEVLGGGTLAWDDVTDSIAPHIHVTVGLNSTARPRTPATCLTPPCSFHRDDHCRSRGPATAPAEEGRPV